MPITKSAKKALRQTKARTQRNLSLKEKYKKTIRKVEDLVKDNKKEEAKKLLPEAYKIIDKAAKRNLIKKNTADRKKSRLTKSINKEAKVKSKTVPEKKETSKK